MILSFEFADQLHIAFSILDVSRNYDVSGLALT
jgi:hypothetical protein